MKNNFASIFMITFLLSSSPSISQTNIKIGEQAPEISITEWISNPPSSTNLDGKYIVLDFWATWCKPCLEAVPHINNLKSKFASGNVLFLSMTDESRETAEKVFDQINFQTPVVTDEYGDTHIRFGDGVKGLAYYPMTVLIDDKNIIRWYGNSDNLTEKMMWDFLNKSAIKVDQLSSDSPLSKKQDIEQLMNKKFDLKGFSDMFHDPNITWIVNIEEVEDYSAEKEAGVSMGNGSYFSKVTLGELFRDLFPEKRFTFPMEYADKKFNLTYINKNLNADSEDQLINSIASQLNLTFETKTEKGTSFQVKTKNKTALSKSTSKGLEGFKKDKAGNLVFKKQSIAGMLRSLSKRTDYYWTFKGKDKQRYAFVITMSSLDTIKESLANHGLEVIEKPTDIETLYFTSVQ